MADINTKLAQLNSCPGYVHRNLLEPDLRAFLERSPSVEVIVVGISVGGGQKQNCIQMRGKMPIQLNNRQRPIGFKFILPTEYPKHAPFVYLDEPENAEVVQLLDYIDAGNRIRNEFILNWASKYNDANFRINLNLNRLLYEVYQLYTQAPPLPFEEMYVLFRNIIFYLFQIRGRQLTCTY